MTPTDFPQSNVIYHHPEDMTPDQVDSIPAFQGEILGGNCDGQKIVVVAWKPDAEDLKRLNEGGNIYLLTFGGLPPHIVSTNFFIPQNQE